MKKAIAIILVLFVGFTGCSQTKETTQQNDTTTLTFSGTYRTVMGVMNPLSCYCYNGGYLTISDDERISISFDDLKMDKVKSGKITVTGHYEEIEHESSAKDPCPGGVRKIFIVESFERNDG